MKPHITKEEMRDSLKKAMLAADTLRDLDNQITGLIIRIEQALWDANYGAFETGIYSYSCRRGKWRFVRSSDRTPVLDLKRDDRAHFLQTLKVPGL
jgi:hypothetical protein